MKIEPPTKNWPPPERCRKCHERGLYCLRYREWWRKDDLIRLDGTIHSGSHGDCEYSHIQVDELHYLRKAEPDKYPFLYDDKGNRIPGASAPAAPASAPSPPV